MGHAGGGGRGGKAPSGTRAGAGSAEPAGGADPGGGRGAARNTVGVGEESFDEAGAAVVTLDGAWDANTTSRVSLLSTAVLRHTLRDHTIVLHVEMLDGQRFKLMTLKAC